MATYAAQKIDSLRRNDPSETLFNIWLRDFTDDVALSEALQANDHVNNIHLCFNDLSNSNTNWNLFLRVLATRENFERVYLQDDKFPEERIPHERLAPFLLALQQNPTIQTVVFRWLRLSGDSLAGFIDAATSITTLSMYHCELEAPGGVVAVAAALQCNTNIQRLKLDDENKRNLIPILNSLASNTTVRELLLDCSGESLDYSFAVKNLLESNTTIQEFGIYLYIGADIDVDTFRSIAESLIQRRSVTAVKFAQCKFDSHEKVRILNSILESKHNLQSLALNMCSMFEDGQEEFRAAILSLLQPDSMLRNLELRNRHAFLDLSQYGFDTAQEFNGLLAAIERSPLERFSIGTIGSRAMCLALIVSLPRMHVRTLKLKLDSDLHDVKMDLLHAVKRNGSLHTIVATVTNNYATSNSRNLLNGRDRMKLTSYSARNEFLAQWMENPTVVPRTAWPEYLAMAQTTGPGTVFPILQVLASSLGPFVGGQCRKRRRPVFCLPS